MTGSGSRRPATLGALARIGSLALVLGLGLTPIVAILPAGTPGAAEDVAAASGLTTTADARYVVDPASHKVHVRVSLAATNHLQDTKTRRYFFDRSFMAVPPGTTGFRISSAGAAPKATVTAHHRTYNLLRIDFGKQLAAGATRTFSIAFDIPDPGGAPTRATRIGASLVSFSAWGLASDGATGGSVTVIFPPGYSVEATGSSLGRPSTDAAGNTTFTSGRLANPTTFLATFSADRPSAYRESTLQVRIGDETIPVTIRAWPDDAAWAKRVRSLLARGLPALSKAIGLPWTAGRPLVVQEAISRNASGFAGRYSPSEDTIEIAYYADAFVILHEAAHAWFDGGLVADRWASEGFSSWYALRAAKAIGEKKVVGDPLTPALAKIRVPLNAWGAATPEAASTPAEDAGYAAALRFATLTAQRAGPAGLQKVWRAIVDRQAAYQPTGAGAELEPTDGAPDWRGLLDLLEDRTGKDFGDLWAAWIVRPREADQLFEREAARTGHDEVVARAGDWRLPRVVRDTLRVWQFEQVGEQLNAASRALDDRDDVAAAASAVGLTPPDTMRSDFEGERGFAAASAEAEAELAAIAAYRDAAASRTGGSDIVQAIGLWSADPDAAMSTAASAFAAGDLETTVRSSSFAKATWEAASVVGRNRIIAVAASLAAIVVGLWLGFRWLRDRRGIHRPTLLADG